MPIYVVIAADGSLASEIEKRYSEEDRCQVNANTWFVRSARVTSATVAADLGIEVGKNTGIVVALKFYSGTADARIAETIDKWESE